MPSSRHVVGWSIVGAVAVAAIGAPAGPAEAQFPNPTSTVFINELHYDNDGTDAGEAIELAAPAGTDLTGWSIVLYNGSTAANGIVYRTTNLSGVVADQADGYGTAVVNYQVDGIQNGERDAVALVNGTTVVQFLSYEGTTTAVGGPANSLTSTDIGVSESSTTGAGSSLALTGSGATYGEFTWTSTTTSTFGSINAGQSFGTDPVGTPVATCPGTLTTQVGTATSAPVSATDPDSQVVSVAIVSDPVVGITVDDAGDGTGTLQVAADAPAGTWDVVIEFGTDDAPPQTATCTVGVTVEEPPPPPTITPISEIQGADATTPKLNLPVTAEAIVTSTFTNQDALDGFFLQEEDDDVDGSAATSEGLFVICRGGCPAAIAVGDLVQVQGVATEFFGMTQIDARPGAGRSITPISSGHPLPTATPVELPATTSTRDAAAFESVEGMIATFPDTLVVSEHFELARYGQIVLTVDEQPYQFTHDNLPDPDGYAAFLADLATRRIILDDDNNDQNDAVTGTADEPYPYPVPGLSTTNRFRTGDTTMGLTGVLHYSFAGQTGTDAWRIRPIPRLAPTFVPGDAPPVAPAPVGGTLRVATFNVLNYFTTIDTTSGNTGPCGPVGGLDCRGADSEAELLRQRTKTVAALTAMDAHVVGLVEIQNDAGASTADLVAALNAATAPGRYAALETGAIGGDAIKVALIYQPAVAVPVGPFRILTSAQDPRFIDNLNRPALIQTFEEVATGERLTVAVNHLKSKGSDCNAAGDPDGLDGQGNCAGVRTAAAEALADFLATDPTGSGDPDFLILGDLNAYRREDPITTLVGAGYTDLIEELIGDDAYSYLFDGQLGYLDHALATQSLVPQVTGVTEWAINADEPVLFDYNDTVRDPGEAAFERESTSLELYLPDPRRSSDHNPLVVGLDLEGTPDVLTIGQAQIVTAGPGSLVLNAVLSGETFADCPELTLAIDGIDVVQAATAPIGGTSRCRVTGLKGQLTFDRATGAVTASIALPPGFQLVDDVVQFDITLDGEAFSAEVTGVRQGPDWHY